MGVDAGYTQEDIIEFARTLTGWTVGNLRDSSAVGKTRFDDRRHEPGRRVIMGQKYSAGGQDQAIKVLKNLAIRPETSQFLA